MPKKQFITRLKTDRKFLIKVIALVFAVLLVPYLAIPGIIIWWLYKKSKYSGKRKAIITLCVVGLFIYLINISPDPVKTLDSKKQMITPAAATTDTPSETPKTQPENQFNIEVTNQIVKKIDGKFRYFFDIRNKDAKPFQGSVKIDLFTNNQTTPIAGDTFDTTKPIETGLGSVVFTDAHTGPRSTHGAYAITKFKYTVKQGDKVVKTGEGVINEELEDLDSYGF